MGTAVNGLRWFGDYALILLLSIEIPLPNTSCFRTDLLNIILPRSGS